MAISKDSSGNWLVVYTGSDINLSTKDKYLDANVKVTGQSGSHSGQVSTHTTSDPTATIKVDSGTSNITPAASATSYYLNIVKNTVTAGSSTAKAKAKIDVGGYINADSAESAASTKSIGANVTSLKIYLDALSLGGVIDLGVTSTPSVALSATPSGFAFSSSTTAYYITAGGSVTAGSVGGEAIVGVNDAGYADESVSHTVSDTISVGATVTGSATKYYLKVASVAATGGGLSKEAASGGGLSGGGLTAGAGAVSGANVTLTDTDPGHGIAVSGSGTVNRAAVTRAAFSQKVNRAAVIANVSEGYTPANTTGTLIAAGSETVSLAADSSTIGATSLSSNTLTKYLQLVTVSANKTFGSDQDTLTGISCAGTVYVHTTRDSGNLWWTNYDCSEVLKLVNVGSLITTSVTKDAANRKATWGSGWIYSAGTCNASEICSGSIQLTQASSTTVAGYSTATVKTGSIAAPTAPLTNSASALSSTTQVNSQYFYVVPTAGSVTAGWITSQSNGSQVNYKVKDGSASVTADNITCSVTKSINTTTHVVTFSASGSKSVGGTASAGWISSVSSATVSASGSTTIPLYNGEEL